MNEQTDKPMNTAYKQTKKQSNKQANNQADRQTNKLYKEDIQIHKFKCIKENNNSKALI